MNSVVSGHPGKPRSVTCEQRSVTVPGLV